ncbi:MAG: hypothetical protein J1E42_05920 [Akkermansiaceae bacterium]|nr:hypothetical protein [Akkermansiaceae bacterium]
MIHCSYRHVRKVALAAAVLMAGWLPEGLASDKQLDSPYKVVVDSTPLVLLCEESSVDVKIEPRPEAQKKKAAAQSVLVITRGVVKKTLRGEEVPEETPFISVSRSLLSDAETQGMSPADELRVYLVHDYELKKGVLYVKDAFPVPEASRESVLDYLRSKKK